MSMTENKVKQLMEIETRCIKTADANDCNRDCKNCYLVQDTEELLKAYEIAIQALDKVQQFESIGTIECFRELTEKAEPKQVDDDYCCPVCHTYAKDDEGVAGEYCPNCGQHLEGEEIEQI